ncbi:unnamed protein product [Symbiodinium sp. CCMP2592]|nr:unnamed protein product [Symbiodinium sp. CCMP2592]
MAASGSCFSRDMAAGSAEEKSLTEGAPRIKFACHPSAGDAEQKLGSLFSEFRSLCEALSHAAVMLEEIGAAPILPDGFVAGNCSALLQGAAEEMLLVTRSGKDAGVRPSESDFVAVQSFDWNEWSCCFCPAKMGAKPTSDTPLHWACIMKAAETFSWPERPLVALHGHALAEKEGLEKAKALKLPISHEETLFSTPEDVDALMELFKVFPYPENKVFIRKGFKLSLFKELVRNKSFASSETSHSTTPGFKLGTVADAEEVLGAPEAVESRPCWSKLTDALLQYLGDFAEWWVSPYILPEEEESDDEEEDQEAALLKRKASRLERPVLDRIVNSNGFEDSPSANPRACQEHSFRFRLQRMNQPKHQEL